MEISSVYMRQMKAFFEKFKVVRNPHYVFSVCMIIRSGKIICITHTRTQTTYGNIVRGMHIIGLINVFLILMSRLFRVENILNMEMFYLL